MASASAHPNWRAASHPAWLSRLDEEGRKLPGLDTAAVAAGATIIGVWIIRTICSKTNYSCGYSIYCIQEWEFFFQYKYLLWLQFGSERTRQGHSIAVFPPEKLKLRLLWRLKTKKKKTGCWPLDYSQRASVHGLKGLRLAAQIIWYPLISFQQVGLTLVRVHSGTWIHEWLWWDWLGLFWPGSSFRWFQ